MSKTLYRIRIDVDISANKPETAVAKLVEILRENKLREKVRGVRAYSVSPYNMATCYICGKAKPAQDMQRVGEDTYRCPNHNQATVLKKTREILKTRKKSPQKPATPVQKAQKNEYQSLPLFNQSKEEVTKKKRK